MKDIIVTRPATVGVYAGRGSSGGNKSTQVMDFSAVTDDGLIVHGSIWGRLQQNKETGEVSFSVEPSFREVKIEGGNGDDNPKAIEIKAAIMDVALVDVAYESLEEQAYLRVTGQGKPATGAVGDRKPKLVLSGKDLQARIDARKAEAAAKAGDVPQV